MFGYYYGFDLSYLVLVVPAILLGLWAQARVQSTYARYSQVRAIRGITADQVARRILDFLSGVAYANNGKVKRIATGTYIITPYTVDLTGEGVLDELENNGLFV